MSDAGTPSNDPRPRVGSYALEQLLGEGSMGQVFEARHVKLDRRVAIKMLRPERAHDPQLVQRFFQEARTVNRINHPHIVGIHDFVEDVDDQGRPRAYCVMEYLEGTTLTRLIQLGPVPLARVLRIVDQVTQALSAAHEVGVIHRDVKPDNIYVSRSLDGEDFARVLDFGVAKLLHPDPGLGPGRTQEGAIIGTPKYMAPEQAASLEVDFRTDVYGVGAILYELLTGRPPFEGEAFGPLVASIITQPVPEPGPITASGEKLPAALERLVMRCLEKDPALRPATLREFRAQLAAAVVESVSGPHRRAPAALFASTAVLTLIAVALLVRPAVIASGEVPALPPLEPAFPAPPAAVPEPVVAGPVEPTIPPSPTPVQPSDAKLTRLKVSGRNNPKPPVSVAPARVSRDAVLDPFAP